MPISGAQFIELPYSRGFWFMAAQRGASEFQIAKVSGHTADIVSESNKNVSSLLAFPLSGTKVGITPADVQEWHLKWAVEHEALYTERTASLHAFRELVDPWLKFDHGRWEK